jgi:hypothetical protein
VEGSLIFLKQLTRKRRNLPVRHRIMQYRPMKSGAARCRFQQQAADHGFPETGIEETAS